MLAEAPTDREPAARMRIGLSGQIRRVFIDDVRRAAVVEQDGSSLRQSLQDSLRRQSG
jgi:hypothetical protein